MVVLTGCNGLVGSFIARKFLQEGYSVRAIRRENSDLSLVKDIAGQIEWVISDVLDPAGLYKAFAGARMVVHAAATVSFSAAARQSMLHTNVEGTSNVVNACLAHNVSRLCFISSIAALGRKKPEIPISENAAWENSRLNSHYAWTKYLSELQVWRGIAEGLPAVMVNPSVVLGPGNWNNGSTQLFKYVWEQRPFYTHGHLNYVDVRDVADAVFQLINSDITGERFILNAGSVAYREIFGRIAEQFGRKKPFLPVAPWMASLVWRLEWMRSRLNGSEPMLTRETARLAKHSFTYSNEKIRRTLPFSFRNLDDTLRWTCMTLKEQYNLPVPDKRATGNLSGHSKIYENGTRL
jgi:dihydroflavonol-4-reductase